MRSYHLDRPGPVDGIVLREEPEPAPGPTGIVVRVRAASLNRRDALILAGRYPLPSVPGVIPVSDGAGEVVAVGDRVTRFAVGDRVVGGYWPQWRDGRLTPEVRHQLGCDLDGMLTEYALLDEQWAVRPPEHLTWEEAATLPCAALTAWNALAGGEPARPGETVLTLGTGPVSLFAVQFAKTMGCRVIATTSGAGKAGRLRALGADHVIDHARTPRWSAEVREITGGRGADLVVETVGPATIEQSVRAAAFYGRIVLLWAVKEPDGGPKTRIEIPSDAYASTLATIRRIFVGHRTDLELMCRAVSGTGLRPVIDRVFDFADAHAAYAHYLKGDAFGKVVIRM